MLIAQQTTIWVPLVACQATIYFQLQQSRQNTDSHVVLNKMLTTFLPDVDILVIYKLYPSSIQFAL